MVSKMVRVYWMENVILSTRKSSKTFYISSEIIFFSIFVSNKEFLLDSNREGENGSKLQEKKVKGTKSNSFPP